MASPHAAHPASLRVVAALLAISGLSLACGGTQYQYVRNSEARTAFKLPASWTVYDEQAFLGTAPGSTASTPDPVQWLAAFDADPRPSPTRILNPTELDSDYPTGLGLVFKLSEQNRDTASFASIRNFLIPVDQLLGAGSDNSVLLANEDIEENGLRGSRIMIQFRKSALSQAIGNAPGQTQGGGTSAFVTDWIQAEQVALLDAPTSRVYVFLVVCSTECFNRHRTAIQAAVDSWTVRPE